MSLLALIVLLAAGFAAGMLAIQRKDKWIGLVVALIALGLILAYFLTGTFIHSGK